MKENTDVRIYTIVSTGADTDRGFFPDPEAKGSYLSLGRARMELAKLINEEKKELDSRYDAEEHSENHWAAYQNGYAAACFTRIEIITSELCVTPVDGEDFCPANHLDECAECYGNYGSPCCKDEESECGLLETAREDFERTVTEDDLALSGCMKQMGAEFCSCPERTNQDSPISVLYVYHNIVPERWRLAYDGLYSKEKKRLCLIGKCRNCKKTLCIGIPLYQSGDALMKDVWESFVALSAHTDLTAVATHDRAVAAFTALFHETDRSAVREWLKRRGKEGLRV